MEQKISACIVIKNEEKLLVRCLESIKEVVEEIIVVHDGECRDSSLGIAKQYTSKVFTREDRGYMEAHLPFAFARAQKEWILRIDADEFLSSRLKKEMVNLVNRKSVDAYEFLWPLWDGERYITRRWPYKLCLFRKEAVSFLGVIHFLPEIKGNILKNDLVLHHQPSYNNFSRKMFNQKWIKWARIQAELYFKPFSQVEKFNYNKSDWPFKIKLRKKFPLFLMPLDFISTLGKDLKRGGYREGVTGLKVAFMYACYRVTINYYIHVQKRKKQ